MTPKFYWTAVARSAFAALGRRGKTSLPGLMADLGMHGKSAQSSLVQALARWARRGLVSIDWSARHGAPRYMLTPTGRALWSGAVRAAQAKITAFTVPRSSLNSPPKVPVVPPVRKPKPPGTILCPECSEVYSLHELREMQRQFGRVVCARCNRNLAERLAEVENREEG